MRLPPRLGYSALAAVALAAFFFIGSRNIEGNPPLWWDEGWTLSVARNWVEHGHYGLYQAGQPAPSTLAAHFPVVASIALSFRLFGVGIWQARMVGLVFTAAALALMFDIARRLYGRKVALATLAILLFSPPEWYMHPVHMGRQVIGEIPSITYLLAGYLCYLLAARKPRLFLPLAALFWAIALMSKAQVQPFWMASILAPALVLLWKRQWRAAASLALAFAGALALWKLFGLGKEALLANHTTHSGPSIQGLAEASALVFTPSVRRATLRFSFYSMFPMLAALAYATGKFVTKEVKQEALDTSAVGRLMILSIAGSWMLWFVALSVGWPRFAFPAAFMSAPIAASTLFDLTYGYRPSLVLANIAGSVRRRTPSIDALNSLAGIVLIVILCRKGQLEYSRFTESVSDRSAEAVARFINTETPPKTMVETYESELLFLLNHPYHYPPPQLDVDFIRRNWHDPNTPLQYDTSSINTEYLIVGPFGKDVYAPLVKSGRYQLMRTIGLYTVYHRLR